MLGVYEAFPAGVILAELSTQEAAAEQSRSSACSH